MQLPVKMVMRNEKCDMNESGIGDDVDKKER